MEALTLCIYVIIYFVLHNQQVRLGGTVWFGSANNEVAKIYVGFFVLFMKCISNEL